MSGLCTCRAEEAFLQVAGRNFSKFFCELYEIFREVNIAYMLQGLDLLDDLCRDLGIAVSAVDDGNTCETVEILFSFAVVEVLHGAAYHLGRFFIEMGETGHDVFLFLFYDGLWTDKFFQIEPPLYS